jgi:hypothetical protein
MATTQAITPELRQWIVAQAQAGHKPDAVLTSMRASGWAEDVALAAMEQTLQGFLVEQAQAQGLPPPVPVPFVDLANASAWADGGDRRVAVPACHRLRRPALARGVRRTARTGRHAAGPLRDRADRHRRERGQRGAHQPGHVLRPWRKRTVPPHRGAHRPRWCTGRWKTAKASRCCTTARCRVQAALRLLRPGQSPARPPSSSAAASAWAPW